MSMGSYKSSGIWMSVLLFIIVFGVWQVYDLIMVRLNIELYLVEPIYVATHIISLAVFLLFVKIEGSDLGVNGYTKPSQPRRYMILSIFFLLLYILTTIAPGFLFGFTMKRPIGIFTILFNILRAILISLSKESIFRGYIFRNLLTRYGFFTSLYLSSIMNGLHRYDEPVSITNMFILTKMGLNITDIIGEVVFTEVLPALVGGLFLGYMFYKMDWSLMGSLLFNFGITLYSSVTPLAVNMPWWMSLTFDVIAYGCLLVIIDGTIQEPAYRRRRFGLEE